MARPAVHRACRPAGARFAREKRGYGGWFASAGGGAKRSGVEKGNARAARSRYTSDGARWRDTCNATAPSRMKKLLTVAGALALLAWTGLGLFAWANVGERVHVTIEEGEAAARTDPALAALADELAVLHADVRALAAALGPNLQGLHDELAAHVDERAAALERELVALKAELAAAPTPDVAHELAALRAELAAHAGAAPAEPAPLASAPAPEPAATPEVAPVDPSPVAAPPAPAEPAKKKSFLAFQLPSDDFRFDERRVWSVLPSLSRVGFDGKSTLHDFTGATSRVEGELEVDPGRPSATPRGLVRVQAAALDTGNADRDAEMREHLAAAAHPEIVFELERFEPATVDAAAQKVAGTAHGKMTIRGVTRALSMPVRLAFDEARRMTLDGEASVHLPDYGVPVPSKLGVISMEDDVKVWIALKLRASARKDG